MIVKYYTLCLLKISPNPKIDKKGKSISKRFVHKVIKSFIKYRIVLSSCVNFSKDDRFWIKNSKNP